MRSSCSAAEKHSAVFLFSVYRRTTDVIPPARHVTGHTQRPFLTDRRRKVQINHKSSTHFLLSRTVPAYMCSLNSLFVHFHPTWAQTVHGPFSATHWGESLPASSVEAFSFSPTATMPPLFLTAAVPHSLTCIEVGEQDKHKSKLYARMYEC